MLEKIKILLGIESTTKDNKLNLLIEDAKAYVVDTLSLATYDSKFDYIVMKMVREDYYKLGHEGVSSTGNEGVSTSFNNGYSDTIIKALKKHRKVRTL